MGGGGPKRENNAVLSDNRAGRRRGFIYLAAPRIVKRRRIKNLAAKRWNRGVLLPLKQKALGLSFSGAY